MNKPPKTRIGFVGVGFMGQCAHLRNYASLPDCEVVAIAEVRPELACRVAARYGIPRVYSSHEAMLAAEQLDGIVASQQFGRHGTLIPELLQAGVPVFTEKPLAASVEMGEKIAVAARQQNTWVMVGYHKRSDPAVMYAKAEIDRLKESGELGELRYVRVTMPWGDWVAGGSSEYILTDDPLPQLESDPRPDEFDEDTYNDFHGFVNSCIHQINLLHHFLGEAYAVTYCEPSGVLFAGRSASGVPCLIEMAPYQTTLDWHEPILVGFKYGYLRIDLPAPLALNRAGRVEVFRDPGAGETPRALLPQMPPVHAMKQQALNFIRAVRGEIPPMCEAREAVEDLRVARDYIRMKTACLV